MRTNTLLKSAFFAFGFIFLASLSMSLKAQTVVPFITIWKTDNPGTSADNQVKFPANGQYDVYWEEVGNEANNNGIFTSGLVYVNVANGFSLITLPSAGTYRFTTYFKAVEGQVIYGFTHHEVKDPEKLIEVSQWGDTPWMNLARAFKNCKNMVMTATDAPNMAAIGSQYTSQEMFYNATSFNSSIGHWTLPNATPLTNLLAKCGMDCINYDATLIGWAANPNTPSGRTIGVGGRVYSSAAAVTARQALIDKGWTFVADTYDADCAANLTVGFQANSVNNFSIHPNPARATVNIKLTENTPNGDIVIYDITGKAVYKNKTTQRLETINIENLSEGIYFLKVGGYSEKLIIQ